MNLFRLFLWPVLLAVLVHAPWASARRTPDPAQPVSIDVPEGWTMRADQGATTIENGQGAFAYWVRVPGGGKDVKRVYGLFDQVFRQYKNFKKLDELEAQLSGSRGFVVIVGGINPRGTEVITKAVAAPFGDDAWVVFASGPVDRFQNLQRTLDGLIASFRVGSVQSDGRPTEPARPGGAGGTPPQAGAGGSGLGGGLGGGIGGAASAGPGAGPGGRALPAGTYRLEPAVIVDPYGQAQPVAAFTLFVPYGWRAQGGVNWSPAHACTDYFNVDWSVSSPDGASMFGVLPQAGWESDNTGHQRALKIGCTHRPVNDVQSYLQAEVQRRWPGARIQGFRKRPDLEVPPKAGPTQGGGQMRTNTEGGEMMFSVTGNGRETRGMVVAVVTFTRTQLPVQGMGNLQFMSARALPGVFALSPAGQFDPAFFERVRRSIQPNPDWIKALVDHSLALRRIEQAGERQRQQIWHNTQEQISALRTAAWNNGQRSADQRAADFNQMIRDVEHYQGADGKKVELAASYANAWKLNDGSYVMSSNPAFDINRDLGIEGRRLDPVRR